MKYIMFVCNDPTAEPFDPALNNIGEWVAEMDGRGVRLHGDRLKNLKDAVTIKQREGQTLTTDGPFAETKEWIAGYDMLECKDLDEAVSIVAKHPMARFGRIELRPVWT